MLTKLNPAVSLKLTTALAGITVLLAFALNGSAQVTNDWTGNISTDWNNSGNWTGDVFPGTLDTATVNNVGNIATLSTNSDFSPANLTVGDGATGTLIITGGALTVTNEVEVGQNGGSGTVNMSGGTITEGVGTEFNIGNGAGGTGVWNMTNGTIISSSPTRVANEGSTATFNMYGGSLINSNYLSIGRDSTGVLNVYGGTIIKTPSITTTVVVGGGGTGTGTGTLNLYGGVLNSTQATVQVAYGAGNPVGTVNLQGGQMLANIVSVDGGSGMIDLNTNSALTIFSDIQLTGGSGIFNFEGGKLIAGGSSAAFMSGLTTVNVFGGGAIIDTTNNTITINQSLLAGDGLGGGLTKLGVGTLFINGTNTYTGPTVVSAGVLGGNAVFPGAVTVSTDAGIAPGAAAVGTLTVGSLTLNNNTTNIYEFSSTTNSLIVVSNGLTLGSTAVTFNLINQGTGLPYSSVGTYNLINYGGANPTLDSTWTTASATNPHVSDPLYGFVYQFGASGGYLTLTITSTLNIGSWGVNSSGNWSVAGNWTALAGTMPPRNPSDSATFGTGSSLLTVTLDANETVGAITMNNTNSFVISGGNTLTLDQLGSGATINVSGGSANAIQTAVALNDNLAVAVNSGESLSLSGNIANASSTNKTLSMTGAGTLALSGNNSYGPAAGSVGTIIGGSGGGILQLGSNNALGAGDVTNASSCTLQAAVASVSVTNNFKLGQTLLVGNNGNSNLTLMGVVSGGGSLTKVGTNTVSLGATNIYTGFTTVSSGTLNVLSGAGIIPSVASAGVFYVGNLSNTPAVMTNSGTIVSGSSGVFYIGDGSDLIGTFDMAGGSLTINNAVRVGGEPATGVNPGNGTFNMSGGTVTSLSYWQVGRNYGVGTMNMTGGNFYLGSAEYFAVANSGSTGTFNMSGGNLYATNQMLVAYANGVYESVGVWNLSGSANVVLGGTKRFVVGIGGNGTLNQSGGSLSYTVSGVAEEIGVLSSFGGTGLWDMSAGTATSVSPLIIGDGAGSAGTLTLSGTAAMSTAGIEFGANTGQGTLNLNGGTLTVNGTVSLGTGSGYFDFNGGTLQAGITSASFMSGLSEATVSSGGAIINTSANSITIGQPLVDGGGGFLTKLGSGTLTLSATNTYSGSTTVSNGTLLVNGSVAGPVTVTSGATLGGNGSVGGTVTVQANGIIGAGTTSIGTLTLGASPVLGGTVVAKLNRNSGMFTNDLIEAGSNPLSYGGTLVLTNTGAPLQVNDTFKLFDTSGSYSGAFALTSLTPGQVVTWNINNLTVNGTITVGSTIPTAPTNLTYSVSGNQLSLSWPQSYQGWLLQSNSVSLSDTGAWATVTGSSATNLVVLTINNTKTNVFFRMILP